MTYGRKFIFISAFPTCTFADRTNRSDIDVCRLGQGDIGRFPVDRVTFAPDMEFAGQSGELTHFDDHPCRRRAARTSEARTYSMQLR